MLRRRWGRIISIGSIVGVRGNAGQSNYAASKAGVIGFTKALSKEVANRNITVNDVAPGYISTDTVDVLPEKLKSFILKNIPQGHFGEVDDVAHLVAFIASEKAKYITGQVIGVDGGLAV
jgi:3-oxoacyl-[acyl-carrier protein] reductase